MTRRRENRWKNRLRKESQRLERVRAILRKGLVALELPQQIKMLLLRAGLKTVGDVVERTPKELHEINGIGPSRAMAIECALKSFDLPMGKLNIKEWSVN
jgi:ERCC4-type nuclease